MQMNIADCGGTFYYELLALKIQIPINYSLYKYYKLTGIKGGFRLNRGEI
jgi:hypothetical protein